MTVGGQRVPVIGRRRLIEAKRYAATRPSRGDKAAQDLKDAAQLEAIQEGAAS